MVQTRGPEECWINPHGPLGRPESLIVDELPPPNYLNRYTPIFVAWGVGTAILQNMFKRRPYYAGVQRHILFAGIGTVAAYYFTKAENNRNARRDLIIEDYMKKHPEDFPPQGGKTFNDVLIPWAPIR
ncbi:NADH dehydrogenase [ubiquinone] 1 subunit C2-like [Branchiostoma floridae x Branchiostoma japonicum]